MNKKGKLTPAPVTYVVDATGGGTHKTLFGAKGALTEAEKVPERTTFITIKPQITFKDFDHG